MQHSERERESICSIYFEGFKSNFTAGLFCFVLKEILPNLQRFWSNSCRNKKKISRSSDGHIQRIQNLNENPKSMLRTNYFPYCYYYYFIWNWKITWLCKKCTVYFIPLNWNSIAVLVKLDKVTGALSNLIKTLQKPYLIVKIPKQLYQILRKR